MAFTEKQKKEARQKAGYRCCWCQEVGDVEIHHIEPQKDDGPHTIDNAAPLCGRCHNVIGDNPALRKQIKERRDWLYERIARMFPDHPDPGLEKISSLVAGINEKLEQQDEFGEQIQAEMAEVKDILKKRAGTAIDNITPATIRSGVTTFLDASSGPATWQDFARCRWQDLGVIGEGAESESPLTHSTGRPDHDSSLYGEADISTVVVPSKTWPDSSEGEEG